MALTKEQTAELVKKFGKNENDTGSTEVQVAILTERIQHLTEHLKANPADKHSRRGMMQLVGQRKGLLKYLESVDIERYRDLKKKLNLR